VSVTQPGGAVTTTAYAGPVTTVTDPATVRRQNTTDALGRLVQVVENPNGSPSYTTSYTYDLLDNLTGVNQSGQTRSFAYDSLKRLRQATNPESGTVTYAYDTSGNLVTRADARGTTCYGVWTGASCDFSGVNGYDGKSRVVRKMYSVTGTPAVTYAYDQNLDIAGHSEQNYPAGRLVKTSSSVSETTLRYDALGRVKSSKQWTNAADYIFGYGYNLAGALNSMTYPSGHGISMEFDPATGRVNAVRKTAGASYVGSILYAAHGAIRGMTVGTKYEETCFNNRLQPLGIRLGAATTSGTCVNPGTDLLNLTLGYGTDPTKNNGNLRSQTIASAGLPAAVTQNYTSYDGLNRLTAATEGANWSRTFGYDAYGNMWVASGSGVPVDPFTPSQGWINAANNRLVNAGLGIGYDNAGNQTSIGGYARTYDGENRQVTSTLNNVPTAYGYDGDGRRVQKVSCPAGTSPCTAASLGAAVTNYVYDAQGQLAAEYATQPETPLCTTCYLTADQLGSTRLMTDGTTGLPKALHDYLPFGEEIPSGIGGRSSLYGSDSPRQRFTGKERDAETSLDFFGARYLSSAQGRFTSADPVNILKQKLMDPQQWNMYAYVRNNPLRFRDPTGQYICSGTDKQCAAFEHTRQQALNSDHAAERRGGSAYGDPGARNGVVVTFADRITSGKADRGGRVERTGTGIEANSADNTKVQAILRVTIQTDRVENLGTVAHEGSHVADRQDFINSANNGGVFDQSLNITRRASETTAYGVSIGISLRGNDTVNYGPCGVQRECKFTPGMMPALKGQLIQDLLNDPRNGYTDLDTVLYPEPVFRNK
jgi:RHS repeat-associated protein